MLPHTTVHHAASHASCTEAGTYEYWQCTVCEHYFSDEACTHQIDQQQTIEAALGHILVHHDAVAATCTEGGMEAYDTCTRCDYVSAHSPIEALGHAYSATYSWADDGSSCTVHIVCANNGDHKADIEATVVSSVKVAATTSSMGTTAYTVSGTYDGYAYSNVKELVNIPALEPMPAHKEGTAIYENDVGENVETTVTETFNSAKDNGGVVELTVSTAAAGSMTITFDNAAVSSIAGNAVTLEATVALNSTEVPGAEMVIEVNLKGATFENGKATVSVPFSQTVPEGKALKVYFINGDKREDMNATLVGDKVVFETNHFSTYAVVFEDAPSSGGNGGEFPIWIIFVIIAVVAVGGGAFFFISKKKA